jgi:hypothetical protein
MHACGMGSLSEYRSGLPALWSTVHLAAWVGRVSEAMIRRSIDEQIMCRRKGVR